MVLLNKIAKITLFSLIQGLFVWLLTDPGWDFVSMIYEPRNPRIRWEVICNEYILNMSILVVMLNIMMEVEPFRQLIPKILISLVGILLIGFIFRDDLVERTHRLVFLLGNSFIVLGLRFYPLEYYWIKVKTNYYRKKRARIR
ncbi:MAG: hypothetical protein ACFB10_25180 [Salibacteraceae bacterium]